MNQVQRNILRLGGIAVIAILLFPPWRVGSDRIGFSFLLRPPAAPLWTQFWGPIAPEINTALAIKELLAVAVLTAGFGAIARTRPSDAGTPLQGRLAARRLELSWALALLCPIPVPVAPVPIGLVLAFALGSGGYGGSGHAGVVSGGPMVILLIALLASVYAAAVYALLTLLLRRLVGRKLRWWPPTS